jgi:hypothetical protein
MVVFTYGELLPQGEARGTVHHVHDPHRVVLSGQWGLVRCVVRRNPLRRARLADESQCPDAGRWAPTDRVGTPRGGAYRDPPCSTRGNRRAAATPSRAGNPVRHPPRRTHRCTLCVQIGDARTDRLPQVAEEPRHPHGAEDIALRPLQCAAGYHGDRLAEYVRNRLQGRGCIPQLAPVVRVHQERRPVIHWYDQRTVLPDRRNSDQNRRQFRPSRSVVPPNNRTRPAGTEPIGTRRVGMNHGFRLRCGALRIALCSH